MSSILQKYEKEQLRSPGQFEIGSTVKVNYRIIEGDKERVQPFQGVVIARHLGDNNPKATFTVRRTNQGYGMERIFPLHSPRIESIEVLRLSVVRRAKLYYLRQRTGKVARLREKIVAKSKPNKAKS